MPIKLVGFNQKKPNSFKCESMFKWIVCVTSHYEIYIEKPLLGYLVRQFSIKHFVPLLIIGHDDTAYHIQPHQNANRAASFSICHRSSLAASYLIVNENNNITTCINLAWQNTCSVTSILFSVTTPHFGSLLYVFPFDFMGMFWHIATCHFDIFHYIQSVMSCVK